MKTLHLVLKRKWFEIIASGEKREEYRDMTQYWFGRLIDCRVRKTADLSKRYFGTDGKTANIKALLEDFDGDWLLYKRFDKVCFQLGYQKNAPRMTFEIESITIGKGREEWGAEKDKEYFVIKLGERI